MSKTRTNSASDGSTAAIIGMVAITLIVLFPMFLNWVKSKQFDARFEAGVYELSGNYIPLGETGNPLGFSPALEVEVPDLRLAIGFSPRKIAISGCEVLQLPLNTRGVKVFTPFVNTEDIVITMPPVPIGNVVVCVPAGATVEIVMWAIRPE